MLGKREKKTVREGVGATITSGKRVDGGEPGWVENYEGLSWELMRETEALKEGDQPIRIRKAGMQSRFEGFVKTLNLIVGGMK